MNKTGKIILNILSWGPLVWTVLILVASKFGQANGPSNTLAYFVKGGFMFYLVFYMYIGIFIWLALNLLFAKKQIISKKQCAINFVLTLLGILAAYLSIHFNVLNVSDGYID